MGIRKNPGKLGKITSKINLVKLPLTSFGEEGTPPFLEWKW